MTVRERPAAIAGRTPSLACAGGYTLVEVMFVAGLIAVIVATAVPQLTVGIERARARAAARYLAGQMIAARTQAVGRAAAVALRFQRDALGVTLTLVLDGNRNGVRMRDIESGLDRQMQASTRLDQLFPGVRIDAPADSGDSAVQLGGTDILSFTPDGTSTSGTVQILGRDGSRFAVRVFGVTGRVRVLQFDDRSRGWMELL
ncbi:MAG TPA: GspH/FimT family pseudopilin [Vicinamibacterales bacterium]|nr:GspH/FimT family pseudopilin [Vicinamibacterales bacterium]